MSATAPARPRAIAGIGRVLLWSGGSLWIGRDAGRGLAHAHHALQISCALSGRIRLRSAGAGEGGEWVEHSAALIRSHHRHQFDGNGQMVAQVFVEPETAQGRALLHRHGQAPIAALPAAALHAPLAALRAGFERGAQDALLVETSQRLVAELCGQQEPPRAVDPRISRAIEFVRSRLGSPVSLAEAAAAAHLSPSRFRHLFVAQTGLSFRAYLLWARVEAAVGAAMGGLSWTEAAQDWGFADSAHLSRTCRRMFGIAPSMLVRG